MREPGSGKGSRFLPLSANSAQVPNPSPRPPTTQSTQSGMNMPRSLRPGVPPSVSLCAVPKTLPPRSPMRATPMTLKIGVTSARRPPPSASAGTSASDGGPARHFGVEVSSLTMLGSVGILHHCCYVRYTFGMGFVRDSLGSARGGPHVSRALREKRGTLLGPPKRCARDASLTIRFVRHASLREMLHSPPSRFCAPSDVDYTEKL